MTLDRARADQPQSMSMRKSPFFSIIMPVYNTADFIAEAIESILAQSFTDWELLLIDDASPDDAIEVALPFAEEDDRIRIIRHEKNHGLSAARNTGLKNARGSYVWFADSDDTFRSDLLETARDEIEETSADVILFGLLEQYYDSEGDHLYDHEVSLPSSRCSDPDSWHREMIRLERDTHFGYSCTKIYRSSIIKDNRIKFQKVRLIEDFLFNVDFFRHASSIAIVEGSFYNYRKIDGRSLTNANSYSAKEYYALHERRIRTMRDLLDEWGVLDDEAKGILGSLYGRYVLSALERTYHSSESFSKAQRIAWYEDMSSTELFAELIPVARAEESTALSISLSILRSGNPRRAVRLAHSVNLARRRLYPLFTRMRSGR